jgi:hypothetical protein
MSKIAEALTDRKKLRKSAHEKLPSLYLNAYRLRQAMHRLPAACSRRAKLNDHRIEPSFFIVGVRKGGTTFLYRLLAQHPQVREGLLKEVNFFNQPDRQNLDYYKSFFPLRTEGPEGARLITGESTPHYMYYPHSIEKLAGFFPSAKVLVVLRDPASRAYSEYCMNVKRGTESETFERALELEDKRLAGERENWERSVDHWSRNLSEYSYRTRGLYLGQIQRLEKCVGKENVLVLKSTALFKDTANQFAQVAKLLNLDPWQPASIEPENTGTYKAPCAPGTIEALREFYKPHNEELFEYLGWEPGW